MLVYYSQRLILDNYLRPLLKGWQTAFIALNMAPHTCMKRPKSAITSEAVYWVARDHLNTPDLEATFCRGCNSNGFLTRVSCPLLHSLPKQTCARTRAHTHTYAGT